MVSFEILQMSYLQIFSYSFCPISIFPTLHVEGWEFSDSLSGILMADDRQPLHLILSEV